MVRNDVRKKVKPEQRNLRQHPPLMRDAGRQHVVESRNAVGRDEQQALIIQLINIAYLAAGMKFKVREIGLQHHGIEKFRCHVLNLTGERARRILAPQKFLSTAEIKSGKEDSILLSREAFRADRAGCFHRNSCGKAEDESG